MTMKDIFGKREEYQELFDKCISNQYMDGITLQAEFRIMDLDYYDIIEFLKKKFDITAENIDFNKEIPEGSYVYYWSMYVNQRSLRVEKIENNKLVKITKRR